MEGFREEPAPFAARDDSFKPPLKTTTTIGRDGRIVIPAAMREAMGVKEGSTLVMLIKGETLEVFTVEAGIRQIQEMVRRIVPADVSLVDELLADRRREVDEEND